MAKFAPAQGKEVLAKPDSKIIYKPYNWGLNDQGSRGRSYKMSLFDYLG